MENTELFSHYRVYRKKGNKCTNRRITTDGTLYTDLNSYKFI